MRGKNPYAGAILAIALLLGLPALAEGGQANVRGGSCAPGLNCKARSFTPAPLPGARFEACTSTIYGRQLFDADAGAYKFCDGAAWQSIGGASGDDAYWADAGVGGGYIKQTRSVVALDGGWALRLFAQPDAGTGRPARTLALYSNAVSQGGSLLEFFAAGETDSNRFGAVYGSSYTDGYSIAGLNLWAPTNIGFFTTGSPGNAPATRQGYFSGGNLYLEGSSTSALKLATVGGGITGPTSTSIAPSSTTGYWWGTNAPFTHASYATGSLPSAAYGRGAITFDGDAGVPKYSDGTRWHSMGGGAGFSIRGSFTSDAGTVSAASCRDESITIGYGTLTTNGAECATGQPAGQAANNAVLTSCWVGDGTTIKFKFCNVSAATVTPLVGTWSCRCWNKE